MNVNITDKHTAANI